MEKINIEYIILVILIIILMVAFLLSLVEYFQSILKKREMSKNRVFQEGDIKEIKYVQEDKDKIRENAQKELNDLKKELIKVEEENDHEDSFGLTKLDDEKSLKEEEENAVISINELNKKKEEFEEDSSLEDTIPISIDELYKTKEMPVLKMNSFKEVVPKDNVQKINSYYEEKDDSDLEKSKAFLNSLKELKRKLSE